MALNGNGERKGDLMAKMGSEEVGFGLDEMIERLQKEDDDPTPPGMMRDGEGLAKEDEKISPNRQKAASGELLAAKAKEPGEAVGKSVETAMRRGYGKESRQEEEERKLEENYDFLKKDGEKGAQVAEKQRKL